MDIAATLQARKESTAAFVVAILGRGQDSIAVARKLELELADQIRYDDRDIDPATLQATWSSLPPLEECVARVDPDDASALEALASSSYAFRLLVLAHVLDALGGTSNAAFEAIVAKLGHGVKEVSAYRDDFVRS